MNIVLRAALLLIVVCFSAGQMACERGKPAEATQNAGAPAPAGEGVARVASASAAALSNEARLTAESIFGDRCAVCHGDNGDGNGPGAANLAPRPMNFHDRKWQQSVSDDKIARAIVYGGQAVGVSAAMAANPDLEGRPDVVAALVERIRKLGR